MIASISCQQKINRHVNVQIWHGCISPLHVSGFHSMAIWIRPKPVRYATWKSNGAICVCNFSLKTSCISYGWSRCTRTQLDPIALIQFNLIVSLERLQRNWLKPRANQMKPSQRPCTRRKLIKQSGVRIPLVQQQGWDMDVGKVHRGHWNLLDI